MRKIFTPLLLIVLFACSKHDIHPVTPPPTPIDSTNSNVYADPGSFNALIAGDTFNSFKFLHAYDTAGFMNITARALVNNDTCFFQLDFPDTLRTNTTYFNNLVVDTEYIGNTAFTTTKGAYTFSAEFYNSYLGTVYLTGVKNNYTGDTIVITSFDKTNHLIAGTFKSIMSANTQQNPYVTQAVSNVTGTFNTYYNAAK